MIVRFFNALGTPMLAFFQYLGEVLLLAADTFRSIFTHRLRWRLFLNQVVEIGLRSQVLVIITGGFTGAVFAAQAFFALPRARPGLDRFDGGRTGWRGHVGRDRHDESDGTDRRAARARGLSD